MNILKKSLFMVAIFLSCSSICHAEEVEYFKQGDLISNAYITRELRGVLHFDQANFILRSTDNKIVYPLDFFAKFNSAKAYTKVEDGQAELLNTTEENWERIEALTYFGYLYSGHEDKLWYPVTNTAIIKALYPVSSFYVTDVLRGFKIPKTDDMLAELNKLVNDYLNDNIPAEVTLNYGETKKIILDELSNYSLKTIDDNISLVGNTLTIKGDKIGSQSITLERAGDSEAIYTTNDYTKLMLISDKPKITKTINLYVMGGNITIKFKQEDKYEGNCSTNDKTVYGLYNEDDVLINTLDLLNGNEFVLNDINYGNYYIKQISHACDVKEDLNKYDLIINKKDTSKTINLKDNYKELLINKKYCNDLKCNNERDAELVISDDFNEYKVKTNQLGNAYVNLGNGIYKIKQLTGIDDYYLSDDLEVNLSFYETERVTLNLTSDIITGTIKVNVVDNDNNPIEGAKVCLYEGTKVMDCVVSNKDGISLFKNIGYGKYLIKESDILDTYVLNDLKYDVNLNSSDGVSLTIENKLIERSDSTDDLSLDEVPETSVSQNNYLIIVILVSIVFLISYRCLRAR